MSFFNQFIPSASSSFTLQGSSGGISVDGARDQTSDSNVGKICPRLPPPQFTKFSETADLCLG